MDSAGLSCKRRTKYQSIASFEISLAIGKTKEKMFVTHTMEYSYGCRNSLSMGKWHYFGLGFLRSNWYKVSGKDFSLPPASIISTKCVLVAGVQTSATPSILSTRTMMHGTLTEYDWCLRKFAKRKRDRMCLKRERRELIGWRKLETESHGKMMDLTGSNNCGRLLFFVDSPSLPKSKSSTPKSDLMWGTTIIVPF